MSFANPTQIILDTAEILKPPRRLSIPEAAEKFVYLNIPGGYSGRWSNDLPHMLVEPAECLTSRDYKALIFVGPAQSTKTQSLVDNWAAHTITCDPADMMIVQTSQETARDYSRRRIDRMHDNCPDIKAKLRPGRHADNTHDKYYRNGMILSIGWPTKNQLAGKAIGKMALTDYDRMPEDVGGEGSAFFLSVKRTTTFLSRGMTAAESSPSKEVIDPKWKPKTPHEAPPTKGILGLFNTGDRRRAYCQCQHCGQYWMPQQDIEAASWPKKEKDFYAAAEQAGLICGHCGSVNGQEFEKIIKRSAIWLKEGQTIDESGNIHGFGRYSDRASFMLPGWLAAFQTWQNIVFNYLSADDTYERTGDEEALKNCYNLDMAAPYLPKSRKVERTATQFDDQIEVLPKRVVPLGVRFLTAAVDVQKGRFVVQVHGWGRDLECWVVDRFNLKKSPGRKDSEGNPLPIDPAGYIEDWDVLIDYAISATYPLDDDSGRVMPVMMTACDSGGEDGVTDRAYDFYRKIKSRRLARKFMLVKGSAYKQAPRFKQTFPDSEKRGNTKVNARKDIPVWMINTNLVKDTVAADLDRKQPGPRYYHFPDWLGSWFFSELTAEQRGPSGWTKITERSRNEAFDLCVYNRGCLHRLRVETMDWNMPRPWAREWDENSEIHDMVSATEDDAMRDISPQETKPAPRSRARRVRFKFH